MGFVLALAILATTGWLSHGVINSMIVSETREFHTHNEMQELGDLLSKLRQVETINRDFVITGNEIYLEPYKELPLVIEQKLAILLSTIQGNSRLRERLDVIATLSREKLAIVEENITLRKTKGFQSASQSVITDRGKWLMDEIARLVAEYQEDEGKKLQEQEVADLADTQKATRLFLTGNILSLTLLCTVFLLLNREIDRRINIEEDLRKHHDHLDRLIQERTFQLKRAQLEAETANHAKSEFLENMSHEMRTPLTGVMGVLDLLLMDARTDKEQHYLEMAKTSANALKRLINDIIDFTRNATGEMSFMTRPFNLRECIRNVVDIFKLEVDRKGLRLLLEISNEVPEMVVGDAGRVRQVLMNLVGNAVKFTDHGEIHISIHPAHDPARPTQDVLLFTVRDTGCGIPADKLENIFEKFTQVDTSSTKKHGGAGLGLPLARQIILNSGGKMQVESRYGEGSKFSFSIPFMKS